MNSARHIQCEGDALTYTLRLELRLIELESAHNTSSEIQGASNWQVHHTDLAMSVKSLAATQITLGVVFKVAEWDWPLKIYSKNPDYMQDWTRSSAYFFQLWLSDSVIVGPRLHEAELTVVV